MPGRNGSDGAHDGRGALFETQVQLRAGHWYVYVLPVLMVAASLALVVKTPSAYWVLPLLTAALAAYANYKTRSTRTYRDTLIWLLVLFCSLVGMFLWLIPPLQNNMNPPF